MDRPTLTRGQTLSCSAPIAGISNESSPARYGRFIGRVGALAVLLGVGTALAVPGVAVADAGETSGSGSTSSSSSSSASGSNKTKSERTTPSRATKSADRDSDNTDSNRRATSQSATETTDSESTTTNQTRTTTSRSTPKSTDSESDTTNSKPKSSARSTSKIDESKGVSEPDSSVDPSSDAAKDEAADQETTDPNAVSDSEDLGVAEEIAAVVVIEESDAVVAETAESSNDRSVHSSAPGTNAAPTVTPTATEEEQVAQIVDADESDPPSGSTESPTTPANPEQDGVTGALPYLASTPASNKTPVTAVAATIVMAADTVAPDADIPPESPVSDSLAVALLAFARRYETSAADAATASVLSGTTGSVLFTTTTAAVPGRTFLQYTIAAVGEVFKTVLRNPMQAIFDPIGTGLYAVNTLIRGLMTDIGLTPANPLATKDAIATQREAAALVATPEVQAAKQATLEFLLSTPLATTSLGAAANRAILEKVVDEYVMAVALAVVSDTPANPRITSGTYLGARYGMDNPDNAYRGFNVDGNSTYVITGNINTAAFISFQVVNGYYGENGQTPASAGVIDTTTLQTDENGNFTITLGQDPADGRPNYIQLTPDAKQVIIRDTFSDWSQVAATLSVERVAGPELPDPPSFQQKAERLANWIVTGAPYWHAFSNAYRQVPVNTVTPAIPTPGGLVGQSSALGHYALTEDQALVVTIRPYDADYVGFQVGTDWFTSIDYANHTSSMNTQQATPNADGSFTYVVSLKDPGVANWIDPAGHPTGLLQVRWQGLAAGAMPPGYKPTVQLVNFDELSTVLPPETVMVTERGRQQQINERRAQLRERYLGIPARLVAFDLRTFSRLF